jgi:hypothetical protein
MNRIETLIANLVSPFQDFQNARQQVLTMRGIATGQGFILDYIGKIVGWPRAGASDTVYRQYLFAKILVNKSTGKREDLIKIARAILGVSAGNVWIRTRRNASFIMEIQNVPVSDVTASVLQRMLVAAVGIGVRIVIVFSYVPLASTFRLDVGPGLDNGQLARGIDFRSTP